MSTLMFPFITRTEKTVTLFGKETVARSLGYGLLRQVKEVMKPLVPSLLALTRQLERTGRTKLTDHKEERLEQPPEGSDPKTEPKVLHKTHSRMDDIEGESLEAIDYKKRLKEEAIATLVEAILGDRNTLLIARIIVDTFPKLFAGHSWKTLTVEQADGIMDELDLGAAASIVHALWSVNQESLLPLVQVLQANMAGPKAAPTSEDAPETASKKRPRKTQS